jgi:hypothetical protein
MYHERDLAHPRFSESLANANPKRVLEPTKFAKVKAAS